MAKFKVTDIRKIPSGNPSRIGKMDYIVTYQLDPLHVYMVTIDKDTVTEADIKQAVKADLNTMARYVNREFETG